VTAPYTIGPLDAGHDRKAFACGVEVLDRYLRTQAGQDARRRVSNCFVAVADDRTTIAGYYTLAASSIPIDDLPNDVAGRLPRYPLVPAALIGRLAVDRRHAGRGLGSALLYDALSRAAGADPAVFALIVDAKDDGTAAFYERFGFRPFSSRPMSLFLPTATAIKLLEK
jgi:ribosomal protein S18 acetylase RimI-like enzyme